MSTCMQASQLLARPDGPTLILKAVNLAIRSARCDIESECPDVIDPDDKSRWWNTATGIFDGPCENDAEFRAMRAESLDFLESFDQFERHPKQPAWIRFIRPPSSA